MNDENDKAPETGTNDPVADTDVNKNPDPQPPATELGVNKSVPAQGPVEPQTEQEKQAEEIRVRKYLTAGFDELADKGFTDEAILLGLSRRNGMSNERRGAIEAFVERLKEIR